MKKLELNCLTHLIVLVALSLPVTSNAADSLYWGNEAAGTIRAANLDGSGTPLDLFSGEGSPCGVAIDPAAGTIYWANFNFDGIRVANLDGSDAASTLFSEEGFPCGVAIDPAAGRIYWANFGTNAIRVANLDGSGAAATLFQEAPGTAPSGVAIDTAAGTIYWANQYSDEIRVGNLDGSGAASTLVSGEDTPIGVAIDPEAGKIYWAQFGACCSGPGAVRVANLDGTGITTLYSGEGAPGGVAIDPEANRIYWANFGSGSIRVGNLDGTGAASTLYGSEISPLFPALLKAPVSTDAPGISGGAKVGRELTCKNGQWAPDLLGAFLFRAPRILEYQWIKDGTDILGAVQATFTPAIAGSYSCRVTASNQAGSTSRMSSIKKVKVSKGGGG